MSHLTILMLITAAVTGSDLQAPAENNRERFGSMPPPGPRRDAKPPTGFEDAQPPAGSGMGVAKRFPEHLPQVGSGMGAAEHDHPESKPRPGPKHAPRPAGSGMGAIKNTKELIPRELAEAVLREVGEDDAGEIDFVHWLGGRRRGGDRMDEIAEELQILSELGEDDAGDINLFGSFSISGNTDDGVDVDGDFDVSGEIDTEIGRRLEGDSNNDENNEEEPTMTELTILSEIGEDDAGEINLSGGFSISGNTDDGVDVDGDFDVTGEIDTHIGRRLGHKHDSENHHHEEPLNEEEAILSELDDEDAGDVDVIHWNNSGGAKRRQDQDFGCTLELQPCPDGSYVSRLEYLDCEFQLCPGEATTGASLGRRRVPTPWGGADVGMGDSRRRIPTPWGGADVGLGNGNPHSRRRAPTYKGRVGMAGRRRKTMQCLCPDMKTTVPAMSASGGCHFEQCPSLGGRRRKSMQCLCPDKSTFVPRINSRCLFEQCPSVGPARRLMGPALCPAETKMCPDGTTVVVRDASMGCEFQPCPSYEEQPAHSEDVIPAEYEESVLAEVGEDDAGEIFVKNSDSGGLGAGPRRRVAGLPDREERRRSRSLVDIDGEERRRYRSLVNQDGEERRRYRSLVDKDGEERRRYRSLVAQDGEERRRYRSLDNEGRRRTGRDGLTAGGHSLSGSLPGRRRIRSVEVERSEEAHL